METLLNIYYFPSTIVAFLVMPLEWLGLPEVLFPVVGFLVSLVSPVFWIGVGFLIYKKVVLKRRIDRKR